MTSPRLHQRSGLTLLELVVVLALLVVLAGMVTPMIGTQIEKSRETGTQTTLARLRDIIDGVYSQNMGSRSPTLGTTGEDSMYDLGSVPRYVADLIRPPTLPTRLRYLMQSYDPSWRTNWNGPYVKHSGATYIPNDIKGFTADYCYFDSRSGPNVTPEPAVQDSWGNPIVIQWPGLSTRSDSLVGLESALKYGRLVSAGPNGTLDTPPNEDLPTKATCGDDVVVYLRTADLRP